MQDSCAQKTGIVVKTKKSKAVIEVTKSSACNSCKACMFGSARTLRLPAINEQMANVGDDVLVSFPPEKPVFAFLILYAIPLVALLIGLFVGSAITSNEVFIALGAFVGLLVGFIAIFIPDRLFFSKKYSIRIIKILNTQGEITND